MIDSNMRITAFFFSASACKARNFPGQIGWAPIMMAPWIRLPSRFLPRGRITLWVGRSRSDADGLRRFVIPRFSFCMSEMGKRRSASMDPTSGKESWRFSYRSGYQDSFGMEDGPVPLRPFPTDWSFPMGPKAWFMPFP